MVNYFTPLDSNAHKDVLNYITFSSIEVTFKVYDIHSKSTFVKVDGADLAIFKKFPYDYETTSILCTFVCGGEPHFFRAKMTTADNYYIVKFPEKIYKIQRRTNFRFSVPQNLSHEFKILEHPRFKYELLDISLGGCKVAIKTTSEIDLPIESDTRIWVQLLDFGGVTLDATIAFTKFHQEINTQIVGLKFGFIDPALLSTLHQTLIQVDRIARGKAQEE